ncbi:MAG: ACT domain-containing protein [Solirubrobacterales bacterium]|nr:ACT domain-containing protein [Solirubrobacterales bacterium]
MALCRLEPGQRMPEWAGEGFVASARTADELSIVCEASRVPAGVKASRGWRALRVAGTLDLAATGVLVSLLAPLGDAGVPIFVISTYDTDYVLVPGDRLDDAGTVLRAAGHSCSGR